jgi:hypothetical protein
MAGAKRPSSWSPANGTEDGRWLLENTHQGPTHFEMEGPDGFPSRWITLHALGTLRWAGSNEAALGRRSGR